jgi:hypothetical protein
VHIELPHALLDRQDERGLSAVCRDTWNWQIKNPNGYESEALWLKE